MLQEKFFLKNKYIFIAFAAVLLIAAIFSTGFYHDDEHFQILEFAGLKLGFNKPLQLAWEYLYQLRPAIQPLMVVVIHKILSLFSISNPFFIATIFRVFTAALFFTAVYLFTKNYRQEIKNIQLQKWFLFLSCFLWFSVFINVRFSSESWSGSTFLIAFALLIEKRQIKIIQYFFIGVLLGLSFIIRYQSGLLIFGMMAWLFFIRKEQLRNLLIMLSGIILIILVGVLIDSWFYGKWTLTIWNYFEQNILHNKTAEYGVQAWWYYFYMIFLKAIPPIGLLIICSVILFFVFKPKHLLTWTVLPFVILHFLIGHKEIRFLFPLVGFFPVFIISFIEIIQEHWNTDFMESKLCRISTKIFWIFNIPAICFVMFVPANSDISLYKAVYNKHDAKLLVYTDANPYSKERFVRYYKRQKLEIVALDSVGGFDSLNSPQHLVVTTKPEQLKRYTDRYKLIYSSYPDWVKNFNVNNWMSRTLIYYVYESK